MLDHHEPHAGLPIANSQHQPTRVIEPTPNLKYMAGALNYTPVQINPRDLDAQSMPFSHNDHQSQLADLGKHLKDESRYNIANLDNSSIRLGDAEGNYPSEMRYPHPEPGNSS
mmetsp:Transcript_18178/g.31096  ORF Transcript_18178/g.31096 Transcript_18178/m.31096 type:complete len:113 (+) Transcript_18178:30-368(+)